MIRKRYATIPLDNVKAMLGAGKMSAADFKKLVDSSDLLESEKPNAKGFVTVQAGGSSQSAFRLTPERV